MEIPDLLVVTKSDMGRVARDTLRDARSALGAAGSGDTPTLAVSCVPPTDGVEAVADALEEHRARIDLPARRLRARRAGALADYVTEHGERGLRRLGGRRAAERWLGDLPAELDVAGLVASLESRAERPPHAVGRSAGDRAV
jgi:LAO/AO transport system kinase